MESLISSFTALVQDRELRTVHTSRPERGRRARGMEGLCQREKCKIEFKKKKNTLGKKRDSVEFGKLKKKGLEIKRKM